MSRTLEQKIAEAEARLQRLKAKSRSLDTAQKVVVGAALLAKVRKPEEVQLRAWLLQFLKAEVTRQADVSRIQPLIDELNALPKPVPKGVSKTASRRECTIRSPQPQRPSVSERVGEEAEKLLHQNRALTRRCSVGDSRSTRMNTGFPQG